MNNLRLAAGDLQTDAAPMTSGVSPSVVGSHGLFFWLLNLMILRSNNPLSSFRANVESPQRDEVSLTLEFKPAHLGAESGVTADAKRKEGAGIEPVSTAVRAVA